MKNLNVCNVSERKFDFGSDTQQIICYGYAEGATVGQIFSCSHNLTLRHFNENGEKEWEEVLCVDAREDDSVVNVTLLTLNNLLCIGLSNGQIFTVNISKPSPSVDLVGVCDGGLQAMEWSPDQELLVLTTNNKKMILMSCTFDPINESFLTDEEFGDKQFITVGWGKKETQFHGSEGKQAAKARIDVDADPVSSNTDTKITWRGDGELYAVGFVTEGIRRFKVFDREGNLQYTSEKQLGLEANLSWRPSGNVIATTQKLQDKYFVSFFEKNGLKHGGFEIPVNSTTSVENITWSSDSEIIALQCVDSSTENQNVLLFTMSNYHWYLKQTIPFKAKPKINTMFWDNDFDVANNKKLHIVLEDGHHFSYTWIWNVNHSSGKNDNDDAVVGVIDGSKVLLTGFRQTVVPPPMAALQLDVAGNVNNINFFKGTDEDGIFDSNTFFVITEDLKVYFYKQTKKFPLDYKLIYSGTLNDCKMPLESYNWLWLNSGTVMCTHHSDGSYEVLEFGVDFKETQCEFILRCSSSMPHSVLSCQPHATDRSRIFIQLSNGEIIEYTLGGDITPDEINFPVACPKFSVLPLDNELVFLGLSYKGNFYFNDKLVMTNVSSYFIHTHFLLLTTLQHVLLCTATTKAGLDAISEYQKTESPFVYKRKIERGAKLVIAVANDTRTVFQMPRGNLEVIQPRPLSLKIIGQCLDSLKYHEAFDLMRKQRINLNLIYDHDPDKFVNSVDIFLESIKNNSWLNLFLSELENIDVTKTMYSSSYVKSNSLKKDSDRMKIDRICDIVRSHISKQADVDNKILPLLTTFVKKSSIADLENALKIIKQLKIQELAGSKKPVGSDEALKYLLYMVDVNDLFNVALGMYDFDLVLLVANKSQKDPKEYVPMLNELNEMEENFKRFTVNKHLKRFDKAVECLADCGSEKYEELKTFVKYHSLYTKALQLFSPDEDVYKQISDDFGSYLRLKKQYVEAGIVYRRAGHTDKAIECFKDALEWELAIELAHAWPQELFEGLCRDLVSALTEEKRCKEALQVLESYGKGEDAIIYAIETAQFISALRLCSKYNRSDLKESHLVPAFTEEISKLKQLITSYQEQFLRHLARLRVVREAEEGAGEAGREVSAAGGGAAADDDLYSDAGSTVASSASRGSGRTWMSGKSRRKNARKQWSLREGGRYEGAALLAALHSVVVAAHSLRPHVRALALCVDAGTGLQSMLDDLLQAMKDSLPEIWSEELTLQATTAAIAARSELGGGAPLQGYAALGPLMRVAPVIQDLSWKLDGLH